MVGCTGNAREDVTPVLAALLGSVEYDAFDG